MLRRPPTSTRPDTLFPYTTLFRSGFAVRLGGGQRGLFGIARDFLNGRRHLVHGGGDLIGFFLLAVHAGAGLLGDGRELLGGGADLADTIADAAEDRKSTRLNSSH